MGLPGNAVHEEGQRQVDRQQNEELVEAGAPARGVAQPPADIDPGAKQTEDRSRGTDREHRRRSEEECRGAACRSRRKVEDPERGAADLAFERRPEQVQGVHVEQDVHQRTLGMEEGMGDHAPQLAGGERRVVVLEVAVEPLAGVRGDKLDGVDGNGEDQNRHRHRRSGEAGLWSGGVASVDHPIAARRLGALRALLTDGGVAGALHTDRPAALAARKPGRPVGMAVADGGCLR
jgi:hypothetical protein